MIAFHGVESIYIYIYYIYIYIYILVSTCATMRKLRKLRHSRGLSQLMGVARNRTRARTQRTCSLHRIRN